MAADDDDDDDAGDDDDDAGDDDDDAGDDDDDDDDAGDDDDDNDNAGDDDNARQPKEGVGHRPTIHLAGHECMKTIPLAAAGAPTRPARKGASGSARDGRSHQLLRAG